MLFILQHLQNMLLQLLQFNLRGTNVFFVWIYMWKESQLSDPMTTQLNNTMMGSLASLFLNFYCDVEYFDETVNVYHQGMV